MLEKLFCNERLTISLLSLAPAARHEHEHRHHTLRWLVGPATLTPDTPRLSNHLPDKHVSFHHPGSTYAVTNDGDDECVQLVFDILQPPHHTAHQVDQLLAAAIHPTDVGTDLLFENEWCRAWDFCLPPGGGDPLKPHHHVLDYAFVYVARGRLLGFDHEGRPGLFDSVNEPFDVQWFTIPDSAPTDPTFAHAGKNGYADLPMREYLIELK